MKFVSIADLATEANGTPIMGVSGTIKEVYPITSGTNDNGPWSLQNMVLTDGKAKIKCKLGNRDNMPKTMMGKKVWITSTLNAKGTFTGMKIKDDNYKGKVTKLLSITGTADISTIDPTTQDPQPEAPTDDAPPFTPPEEAPTAPPAQHAPTAQRPQAQAPVPAANAAVAKLQANQKAVTELRHALGSAANTYMLCISAGKHVAKRYIEQYGEAMEDAQFQAMVSTLFIHADKRGLVLDIPAGDITPYLPAPKAGEAKVG